MVNPPFCTAAMTAALRRATHLVVVTGGNAAGPRPAFFHCFPVFPFTSGPLTVPPPPGSETRPRLLTESQKMPGLFKHPGIFRLMRSIFVGNARLAVFHF